MGFQFTRDDEAANSAGLGGLTTGVYKVTVEAVVFKEDSKGNPRATFYFTDANGKRAIVFDMCIAKTWKTGSENLDYKKWQEFAAITNMQTGAIGTQNVKTSKTETKSLNVFTECTGKVVNVALQETFDVYNGKETNDKSIYRTFNAEGKSLAEIATNTPAKSIEAIKNSLKPYETKAYKAFKAGGGASEQPEQNLEEVSAPVADDSLI